MACEERFDVRIPDEALERLATVGDAVDYITHRGSSRRERTLSPSPVSVR